MRPAVFLGLLVCSICLICATATADSGLEEHLDDARSLYYAGHWTEAHDAFDRAYDLADKDTKLRAATALEWGTLMWEQGDYQSAQRLVNEALEIARELELDDATGELLVALGHIEASRGELASAENTLNICVQLTGELNDPVHRALCRINRRMVRTLQGKDPGSDDEYRRDIAVLGDAESSISVGTSLAKTSELYRDSGDYERAQQMLDQAHEMYREAGSVPALTRNQLRKAQLLHHQKQFDEARPIIDGLLERFETMRNRPMIVHTLALQAEDAIQQGDIRRGISLYRRALTIADDMGNPQLTGRIQLALCEMNSAESTSHCQRATEIFETTGMRFLEIRSRTALARTYQSQRKFEDARTTFRRAIEQLERAVDTDDGPHALSRTLQYANLCQVETQMQATGALTTCREALSGIDSLDDETRQRHANLQAATVHAAARSAVQHDQARAALAYFKDAADLYEASDTPRHQRLAADIQLRIGAIQRNNADQPDEAAQSFQKGLALIKNLDQSDDEVATIHISLLTQLAQLHRAQTQWSQAIDVLTKLTQLATDHGDLSTAAWAYSGLANAYGQTERNDKALEALQSGRPLAEEAQDEELIEIFDTNLERLQ